MVVAAGVVAEAICFDDMLVDEVEELDMFCLLVLGVGWGAKRMRRNAWEAEGWGAII
jgi:hypothetical protein